MPVMQERAIRAARADDQAYAERELTPYPWVHPDDDDRR